MGVPSGENAALKGGPLTLSRTLAATSSVSQHLIITGALGMSGLEGKVVEEVHVPAALDDNDEGNKSRQQLYDARHEEPDRRHDQRSVKLA